LVLRLSQDIASNYRNRPPEDDPVDEEIREAWAVAAFNTGWLILQAMGFRPDDIREIRRRTMEPAGLVSNLAGARHRIVVSRCVG
jgi:hypothetical protein